MASGARTKFGAPVFEPEVLSKQICCIEGSICDIVGNFRCPIVISVPVNYSPFAPDRYAPEWYSSICNLKISG